MAYIKALDLLSAAAIAAKEGQLLAASHRLLAAVNEESFEKALALIAEVNEDDDTKVAADTLQNHLDEMPMNKYKKVESDAESAPPNPAPPQAETEVKKEKEFDDGTSGSLPALPDAQVGQEVNRELRIPVTENVGGRQVQVGSATQRLARILSNVHAASKKTVHTVNIPEPTKVKLRPRK